MKVMKCLFPALALLVFISCTKSSKDIKPTVEAERKSASETAAKTETRGSRYPDTTFFFRIKRGKPSLKFEYVSSQDRERINKINIFDSLSGKLLQTIDSAEMNDLPVQVDFDDYNFDGWIDVYIKDGCMILGNCHGVVLLYDSASAAFKRAHQYDEMTTVRTFPQKKIIYSTSRSAGGSEFTHETYRFLKGEMVLVEFETQEPTGEKYHYVLKKRDENGKMIIVIDEYLDEPRL
jgi:hypothetical protein